MGRETGRERRGEREVRRGEGEFDNPIVLLKEGFFVMTGNFGFGLRTFAWTRARRIPSI
jgi:hypothetical protein